MAENFEKRGYLLEDFRLFHLNDAQGMQIGWHYHEFCKILLLGSGTGNYWVEGRRYPLQPGDLVLLGSRVIHRPDFEPGQPYDRTILYISPDFLRRESTGSCSLAACFSGDPVLRPDAHLHRRLSALTEELERELSGSGYGREILCNGNLLRMLVELGRARRGCQCFPQAQAAKDPRILDLLAWLDAHLGEDLTMEQLAQVCYMSKYHMMHLFRAETGSSIHSYVTDRRLFFARDLMARGTSATEACFRAGWRSYSSFTRAFAKRFGTTPTGRADPKARREETFE